MLGQKLASFSNGSISLIRLSKAGCIASISVSTVETFSIGPSSPGSPNVVKEFAATITGNRMSSDNAKDDFAYVITLFKIDEC